MLLQTEPLRLEEHYSLIEHSDLRERPYARRLSTALRGYDPR